jgi:hypothetical protein
MENSSWAAIQGITGIGCFIVGVLHWAGITPSTFRRNRERPMPMKSERRAGWTGAILTTGLVLFGGSSWLSIHTSHPISAWLVASGLCVLDVILWVILLSPNSLQQEGSGTPWKTKEHWRLKYEAEAEELRKLEVSSNAELWRANEARRQCEEEKHRLQEQVETITVPSRLVIHEATYGAIEGGGIDFPVSECLQKLTLRDGLAFEIFNHNFVVDNVNYVPDDPKPDKEKRLKLTYTFAGSEQRTIRRREKSMLVLPEDPYIEGFPLLRLDVIDTYTKLRRFFEQQKKRVMDEQVSDAGRAGAQVYSATPDQHLTAEYDRSLKSEVIDLYQRLIIYGKDNELRQLVYNLKPLVYNVYCRDVIEKMMEILWQIAPKITQEDDEKNRVPGRSGRAKEL